VILPDANLLLYALDETTPEHSRAREWLERSLSGAETVAFAWVVLLAIVRLTTRTSVVANPLSPAEAFDVIDGWLGQPNATVVHPGPRHAALLRELLVPLGTAANLTTDAHLAALAREHGAVLHSRDADFGRFPGVRWVDPLR
jgi:toxin-antitoxin system PIN domain toxin